MCHCDQSNELALPVFPDDNPFDTTCARAPTTDDDLDDGTCDDDNVNDNDDVVVYGSVERSYVASRDNGIYMSAPKATNINSKPTASGP